jgi:hypothetical protein
VLLLQIGTAGGGCDLQNLPARKDCGSRATWGGWRWGGGAGKTTGACLNPDFESLCFVFSLKERGCNARKRGLYVRWRGSEGPAGPNRNHNARGEARARVLEGGGRGVCVCHLQEKLCAPAAALRTHLYHANRRASLCFRLLAGGAVAAQAEGAASVAAAAPHRARVRRARALAAHSCIAGRCFFGGEGWEVCEVGGRGCGDLFFASSCCE